MSDQQPPAPSGPFSEPEECSACDGEGLTPEGWPCDDCDGTGWIETEDGE